MTMSPKHRHPITVSDEQLSQRCARGRVVVVDDDDEILSALAALLELEGYACETYASAMDYLHMLNDNRPCFAGPCCVLCDVKMPELDGLQLQSNLTELNDTPLLRMSGASGAQEAVSAFRAGALDFLIKPIGAETLLRAFNKALLTSTERHLLGTRKSALATKIATLTDREREIARRAAEGQTNPSIADELGISLRTVKLHRQRATEKLGAESIVDLARIADEGSL